MSYELKFHVDVSSDIDITYNWYEDQLPGLGERFLEGLQACYRKLNSIPLSFGKIGRRYRKISVRDFPFIIIFEVAGKKVYIYAVFHTSRNPKIIGRRKMDE